jgi:hypothetical protein
VPARSQNSPASTPAQSKDLPPNSAWRLPNPLTTNPLTTIESFLKRDEADILLIAGNVALVTLEIIEWPVAVLTLAAHAMARSRIKALQAVADVAEEVE